MLSIHSIVDMFWLKDWMTSSRRKMKKHVIVVLMLAILLMVFIFTGTSVFMHNISYQLSLSTASSWTKESRSKHVGDDVIDPGDPRFYNIILEEEALDIKPCTDIKLTASAQHATLSFIDDGDKTYSIGDDINILVTIKDSYGKRVQYGGDHLRATIETKQMKASAPCIVTDIRDGTHTVTCEAFWSGISSINVTLAYTRETVATNYRIRTQVLATRNINGLFQSGAYKEDVLCHPNNTHLLHHSNYRELCNMTYMNSGMPFYCEKPKNEHLLCQDWEQVRTHQPYPKFQVTDCEKDLLKRGQQMLVQTLLVNVLAGNGSKSRLTVENPTISCLQYNLSNLWRSRRPSGYFYDGKWNFVNCLGFKKDKFANCLLNRRIYMFGDSTIRDWYKTIIKRFECIPTTEKWTKEKWHKMAECQNKKINFKAGWYPHAQPFYVGTGWGDVRYTLYSTSRQIDNIPQDERAIIVIHLFMHFLAFHHSVFKQRMEFIRGSIERLFSRNKFAIVMIKGPHTFTDTPVGSERISDYFGFVYSKIMYDVFDGLFGRIVLLNNRDITIAKYEKWNHPADDIVNYMMDQMLSYVCEN